MISEKKLGSDIPSRFLRQLQKTAGFGTKAVVDKAVIHQAFIQQMSPSVRAHLATQPDSASLENLSMLADHAVAAEKDVDEAKPGAAEINVSESGKLVGLMEDLSRRLKKITDSHSQGDTEENIWTLTNKREPCRQDTVRAECASKTVCTKKIKLVIGKMYQIITKKIVVLTHRHHKRSKITLLNRSTQQMHLFVFITKHSVTEHARAENLARFL